MLWRRSYDTPPPPIDDDDEFSQVGDPRYATLPDELRPRTECLADVVDRMLPYWYDAIVPDLLAGQTVLVAAHGNSLRALVKHLDGMTRRGRGRPQHPDRHPAALRARRATCGRPRRAGSTSTPTPRPRRSRPSPTKAAEPRPGRSEHAFLMRVRGEVGGCSRSIRRSSRRCRRARRAAETSSVLPRLGSPGHADLARDVRCGEHGFLRVLDRHDGATSIDGVTVLATWFGSLPMTALRNSNA